jgi:hypothetical protein
MGRLLGPVTTLEELNRRIDDRIAATKAVNEERLQDYVAQCLRDRPNFDTVKMDVIVRIDAAIREMRVEYKEHVAQELKVAFLEYRIGQGREDAAERTR